MTGYSIQATAIPRFLLPQFSWSARAIRPAARGALEARRHRSTVTSDRRTTTLKPSILQAHAIRQWRQRPSQYAAGYAAVLECHRDFSASAPQPKDHHFDTLKFVQRLKEEGFSEEQAEGMMRVLSDVIEERCVPYLALQYVSTNMG